MLLTHLLKESKIEYDIQGGLPSEDMEILDLVYDSRRAAAQTAFICLTGSASDGHHYAENAYRAGCRCFFVERSLLLPDDAAVILCENTRAALAALSSAFFGHPAGKLKIIGVTGTKGKTTVTSLIYTVLNKAGFSCGVIGSNGIRFSGQYRPTLNTTPESYELQKTFRDMADAGIRYVAMEVSSQALFTYRVDGIRFDIAVFTNLSEDHIGEGEHPDFSHYKRSKMSLFRQCRFAVMNADDPAYKEFAAACISPRLTYGIYQYADLSASAVHAYSLSNTLGISFHCKYQKNTFDCSLKMPGVFNVYNALAVIAVCTRIGVPPQTVSESLSDATVTGRFEIINALSYCTVVIDYAHNASSMKNLLETARSYHPHRIICLFGSVGGRTRGRRRELSEIAADLADFCILTSDNPNYENPADIISDMERYFDDTSCPHVSIPDRAEAIRYALHMAQSGDILLLCGKGHEDYQLINGIKVPFSEKKIVLETAANLSRELHSIGETKSNITSLTR